MQFRMRPGGLVDETASYMNGILLTFASKREIPVPPEAA